MQLRCLGRYREERGGECFAGARRNGIRGFTAEVLRENKPMQAVINKSNCKIQSHFAGNVLSYEMDF